MAKQTEAFARTLIDAQLNDQHWQISDGTSVRNEYTLPNVDRADYMLCSREGRGLAIVEVKRESINAADAREQGRRNAEQANLPFVFLANGPYFSIECCRFKQAEFHLPMGVLTQPVKRVQIKALASGSAGSMPNISKARLKTLDIEVPPLDRQTAYAQALEQIISIRSQQATATANAQATFDALLAHCFAPTTALVGGSSD